MSDRGSVGGGLTGDFRVLADRLISTRDVGAALDEVVTLATRTIPFCDWAGITQLTGRSQDRFTTVAATDPVVTTADHLQYELAEGPCVDAARVDGLFQAADFKAGSDWPAYGAQVTDQTPIRSALSLTIHPAPTRAALNLYSADTHAFTVESVDLATVFGAHAQLLLMLARETDKVTNLDRALTTSRLIGNAVGILMYAHRITDEQAFLRLRTASSNLNRKLTDIATEVTQTGELPPTGSIGSTPGRAAGPRTRD